MKAASLSAPLALLFLLVACRTLARVAFPDRIDAILVTHAHFDHLPEVPAVQQRFGGRILASPTGCFIAQTSGTGEADTGAWLILFEFFQTLHL